ncbi:MAG: L,D-transpeptidase family protein [Lactobacillus sp.]|nr:L,D-transpeptidase family protein [Lactobacillus sp.]
MDNNIKKLLSERKWIAIGLSLVLIVLCGLLFSQHNQKQRDDFSKTHFAANAKIYGVNVGNLTVKDATKKVNKTAKNKLVLADGKIVAKHTDKYKVITKKEVAKIFKDKDLNVVNTKFNKEKTRLEKILATVVSYKILDETVKFKASDYLKTLSYQNGKMTLKVNDQVRSELDKLDKKYSTVHKKYELAVPEKTVAKAKKITVQNNTYGWEIYTDRAINYITEAFKAAESKTIDAKDTLYGLGYWTYGLGYDKSNNGLGDNYIVVSIKKQSLWIIENGQVAVYLPNVVTGTLKGKSDDQTPTGVFYIHYKQSPSVLRGTNSDGSKYASKVQYWMPFTLSGCGLHDASWRTDWSKTAYLAGGSHGCVNIKPSQIKTVWKHVHKHEPIVIYY